VRQPRSCSLAPETGRGRRFCSTWSPGASGRQSAGRLRTPEPEDEAEAVELAGALRLDRAVLDLERRAFGLRRLASETFAFQARVSLAKMGHARAGREILRDLSGWSRHRRTLAVAAAGRARLGEALPLIEAMRGRDDRADQAAVTDALTSLADA
jgi:hypothetical protein